MVALKFFGAPNPKKKVCVDNETRVIQSQPIDPLRLEFKPGDWVFDGFRIAKVKDVWIDVSAHEVLGDLYPYSASGVAIGRWTPSMGGPRDFEPCCNMAGWRRIEQPKFPIPRLA